MNPADPRGEPVMPRRQATVLESVEDIRSQIRGRVSPKKPEEAAAPTAGADRDVQPFRPTLRPSMAWLCVLDDGDDTGETLRIRGGSFVIGRVEGNLLIPHDGGVSGRHAEITRRLEHGESRWFLKDLQSTNGTFVRAATVMLSHEQELLIGSRRFRFEVATGPPDLAPSPSASASAGASPETNATRKWAAMPGPQAVGASHPAMVDISSGSPGRRFPLTEPESWVGHDPQLCSIVIDDPMVDRRHARLYRDDKNRWVIANNRSRNGLWARIQEVGLGRGGFFQCGEQRFFFKVL